MRFRFVLLLLIGILATGSLPAQAQRFDTPPYGQRGEYVVGVRDFQITDNTAPDRPLDATVWYPAVNPDDAPEEIEYSWGSFTGTGRAIRDAAPNTETAYPLVIFSHGWMGIRYNSIFLTEHLASHGFVVIAADHPGSTFGSLSFNSIEENALQRPVDIQRIIAFAETQEGFSEIIDMERIAVMGHSLGGYTAVASSGAVVREQTFGDPRIKALVVMAPAVRLGEVDVTPIEIPTLVLVGSADNITPADTNADRVYDEIASELKAQVTFENGGHSLFIEACPQIAYTLGLGALCSEPVWDLDRAHDLINHFTTAFLLDVLTENEQAAGALSPSAVDIIGVNYRTTYP
jgi:predicted dienelactone hydrolase